ncbi:hypothetical protein J4480_01580 [Candidatus Woesearchaeota archaeon]|nr:hypothetical protein [Candidatus Woesearchaeota archaeon]
MERNIAELLVKELEHHPPLTPNNLSAHRRYLIDLLASTDAKPSTRFYEEIKPNGIQIRGNDENQVHVLSIGRILINPQAKDYELSSIKSLYEAMVSVFGIYDSDSLTRRLRMDKGIVEIMNSSPHEFSLLGKLESYEDFSRKVMSMPILMIPGVQNLPQIKSWEYQNSIPKEHPFEKIGEMITGWYRLK